MCKIRFHVDQPESASDDLRWEFLSAPGEVDLNANVWQWNKVCPDVMKFYVHAGEACEGGVGAKWLHKVTAHAELTHLQSELVQLLRDLIVATKNSTGWNTHF